MEQKTITEISEVVEASFEQVRPVVAKHPELVETLKDAEEAWHQLRRNFLMLSVFTASLKSLSEKSLLHTLMSLKGRKKDLMTVMKAVSGTNQHNRVQVPAQNVFVSGSDANN